MLQYLKILLLFITISVSIADDPETLFNVAQSQLLSGDLDSAESSFNAALNADSYFAPALQGLSKLYLYKGDFTKAYENAKQALKLDEEGFRPWMAQLEETKQHFENAKRSIKNRIYEEAIKECNMILAKHPYSSAAEYYLGYIGLATKDIDMAAKHFNSALSFYPNYDKAKRGLYNITKSIYNQGNSMYKRGDLAKARENFLKALEYDPNFEPSYYQLGVLEKASGNSSNAKKFLNKAIALNPDNEKSWFMLGIVYELDRQYDEAITSYKKAIEVESKFSKPYGNLGKLLYVEKQEFLEAEAVLKDVTQLDTAYANGFMHLGILYKIQAL